MAAATKLAAALLNVQKKMPALEKDGKNPHFKNRYVTLDNLVATVQPLLAAEGVLLMQPLTHITTGGSEPVPALETRLELAATGEALVTVVPLVLDKQTSQGLGSAVTYTRRYALAAALGLVSETDDDGNAASGGAKTGGSSSLKKQVFEIARDELGKKNVSVAEVAKHFGVKGSELSDDDVLQSILDEYEDE